MTHNVFGQSLIQPWFHASPSFFFHSISLGLNTNNEPTQIVMITDPETYS